MTEETLTTCLWFDGNAEEAARFYVSIFPDSVMRQVTHAPADYPAGREGDVLTAEFTLMGREFVGLNGGGTFKFNEAVSFQIPVLTQKEVDRYYEQLSAVPEAEQCGWIKDRFGMSWQIVPVQLMEYLKGPDREQARRVFVAMMDMRRIDIAGIESAAKG